MMNSTYLIQRLCKRTNGTTARPYYFGVCLEGDPAVLTDPLFTFDYMGAAEFEFGAIPKALNRVTEMFRKGEGCTGTMTIKNVPVYYLCKKEDEEEIKQRIVTLSEGKIRLKEYSNFPEKFKEIKEGAPMYYERNIGWLELDNAFFFFTDKDAYCQLKSLMETQVQKKVEPS